MISEKDLDKFKKIYKEHFDIELSNQEALDKATKVLRLVEIVYKPMTKDDYEKVQTRREKIK